MTDVYGPIYRLSLGGEERIFVGGFDLFDELCDETRFFKIPISGVAGGLPNTPRGLFTAESEKDVDWGMAHRILMPAFGPMAIESMFDGKLVRVQDGGSALTPSNL
jgi:cytochrome P450/NADPH-cytochrome P450 reductase